VGRRHGREGIQKYTEAQTVALQRLLPVMPPPGVTNEMFARLTRAGIKAVRWLP
jgi:succinate-semialdehyde dehydrogenase/glutarate-semialdehyde dehydrogenase